MVFDPPIVGVRMRWENRRGQGSLALPRPPGGASQGFAPGYVWILTIWLYRLVSFRFSQVLAAGEIFCRVSSL